MSDRVTVQVDNAVSSEFNKTNKSEALHAESVGGPLWSSGLRHWRGRSKQQWTYEI